jgi:predicted HTH transcriptional regulator
MLQTDLETAIDHQSESTSVDYKSSFDFSSAAEWVEIVKDVVAFANSGGGVVIF